MNQTTYLPDIDEAANAVIADLIEVLDRRNAHAPNTSLLLLDENGQGHDVPESIIEALLQIAQAMNAGKAVTVTPVEKVLTTQQVADYLGVSRPTLVKLLEQGAIPFDKVSTHRRVNLSDLVLYEQSRRERILQGLDEMAREAFESGMAERTVCLPPAMR